MQEQKACGLQSGFDAMVICADRGRCYGPCVGPDGLFGPGLKHGLSDGILTQIQILLLLHNGGLILNVTQALVSPSLRWAWCLYHRDLTRYDETVAVRCWVGARKCACTVSLSSVNCSCYHRRSDACKHKVSQKSLSRICMVSEITVFSGLSCLRDTFWHR